MVSQPIGAWRSLAGLATATTLAQLITVAASPVLTRIYDPAELGLAAALLSMGVLLVPASSLRLDAAIGIVRDDAGALYMLMMATLVHGLFACAAFVLVGVFAPQLSTALRLPGLIRLWWIVPTAMLIGGLYRNLGQWALRARAYPVITRTRLYESLANVTVSVGFGIAGLGAAGFALGTLCGQTVAGVSLMRLVPSIPRSAWHTHRQRATELLHRYRDFPLVASWEALFSAVALQMPLIMMASLFTTAAGGWFALAFRVAVLPLTLIGTAAAQLFLGEAAVLRRANHDIGPLVRTAATLLLLVGVVPASVLIAGGASLFEIVFGSPWRLAGLYAALLSPWAWILFVAAPLMSVPWVMEHQRVATLLSALDAGVRVTAIAIGAASGSATTAVLLLGSAGFLAGLVRVWWYLRLAGVSLLEVVLEVWKPCALALLVGGLGAVVTAGQPAASQVGAAVVVLFVAVTAVLLQARRSLRTHRHVEAE